MKKVLVGYDPATGQVFDKNGNFLLSWAGLEYEEVTESKVNVALELAKLGYSADDIVKLSQRGIL